MTSYRQEMDARLRRERLRARKPYKHFRSLGEYSRIRFPDCRSKCECESSNQAGVILRRSPSTKPSSRHG